MERGFKEKGESLDEKVIRDSFVKALARAAQEHDHRGCPDAEAVYEKYRRVFDKDKEN